MHNQKNKLSIFAWSAFCNFLSIKKVVNFCLMPCMVNNRTNCWLHLLCEMSQKIETFFFTFFLQNECMMLCFVNVVECYVFKWLGIFIITFPSTYMYKAIYLHSSFRIRHQSQRDWNKILNASHSKEKTGKLLKIVWSMSLLLIQSMMAFLKWS